MKFLASILSFLVMGLSMLPCDDESCISDSEQCRSELNKQHNQEKDHNDACSPFCHCTCCTGFSITHIPVTASSLVSLDSGSYSSYLTGPVINYSSPVWQPPRLG